jgi:hypothetical protein
MLIIAMPKSGSTALMETLGKSAKLPALQQALEVQDLPVPLNFSVLAAIHSDCREIDELLAARWSRCDAFFKQHVPPTTMNLANLSAFPKVVLVRRPKDIIASYMRSQQVGVHRRIPHFSGCKRLDDWIVMARSIGLIDELERFQSLWQNAAGSQIVVEFDELTARPDKAVRSILEFFGVTPNGAKPIQLSRARYSRGLAARLKGFRAKGVRALQELLSGRTVGKLRRRSDI